MTEPGWLIFLNDKRKWTIIFFVTYLSFFYWLPKEVPLYYSQALPEDKLASRYLLLIIPLLVLVFQFVSELFLERLALKNVAMLRLIRYFKIGFSVVAYFIFLKIIILMF
jgi:hypothetical protein